MVTVLMAEQNDDVTLCKHESTHPKQNKETGNDHVFPVPECCGIVLKNLEHATAPAMDIKAVPASDGRENRFRPVE